MDFIIIFEKEKEDEMTELICFEMKSKRKIIRNNEVWQYFAGISYCIHQTKNDYFIY